MENDRLLDHIDAPSDIKKLSFSQLGDLCAEIREELIRTISSNGGHLASNLGTVELTVAIHRIFNSPKDQIVWDVGHQSYTHKLLTGRRERFHTLRKAGGISGFPKPCESEHDAFGAGHSSTSISAACGLARAKALAGDDGYVVAVIGDGALTGGLAYEGLNNAGRSRDRIIIILNDNKMSISKNVGAMARHLTLLRLKPWYFRIKDIVESILLHLPPLGVHIRNALVASKSAIKNAIYHSTIFEDMGVLYLGPVDGHDIQSLSHLLERAKTLRRPVLIHAMTVKGKGYSFAENDPGAYHGVSRFNVETGDPVTPAKGNSASSLFGHNLCLLAQADSRICAITAAMTDGTGLTEFSERFRPRFFDVGIAEEHATVFAAGLAANGMLPVFAVYSTFLQRAYDQIVHDVALQKLKVVFAVDRAGLVGDDGETHQGIFDAAFLSSVPGVTVFSPSTAEELQNDLHAALYGCEGPAAVRYPRGVLAEAPRDFHPTFGNYDFWSPLPDAEILLVTYGRLFFEAAEAVKRLAELHIRAAVLKLNRIKPLEPACFSFCLPFKDVLFFEEGIRSGGIGEHFGSLLGEQPFQGRYRIHAIEDRFVPQGDVPWLLAELGLDCDGMVKAALAAHNDGRAAQANAAYRRS